MDKVQTAAMVSDPENAVTWAFYAYENCVVALAEQYDYKWKKNHVEKARLARRLHEDGLVSWDISVELGELNNLRKDVSYYEPGPDLQEKDLEDLASELEEFIDEIDSRIGSSK